MIRFGIGNLAEDLSVSDFNSSFCKVIFTFFKFCVDIRASSDTNMSSPPATIKMLVSYVLGQ